MSYNAGSAVRRPVLLVAVTGTLALLAALLNPLTATAGERPPDPATQIRFVAVSTPSIALPDAPGTPASFIVQDVPFDAAVEFLDGAGNPAPLSSNQDVKLRLSVGTGPDSPADLAVLTVPKGQTTASFSGVSLATPANGVVLRAASVPKKPADAIAGDSAPVDVLEQFVAAPASSGLVSIGGAGDAGTGCEATPSSPVCADLVLPNAAGVLSDILLSLGACDAVVECTGSVVQALVGLSPDAYTRDAPATLVMKCDKTLCGGGGIPSFDLLVDLTYDGAPTTEPAPACPSKGTVGADQTFCVDYVQSTRDNAGDLHLFLLFVQDARVRFP